MLDGKPAPLAIADKLALAELCAQYRQRPRLAAALYAEIFAADASQSDPFSGHRLWAACASAQAGAGQGVDAPLADERPKLRQQALDWFTADLEQLSKILIADRAANAARIHSLTGFWLADSRLQSVRTPDAGALADDEATAWQAFWREVQELHSHTVADSHSQIK